MSFILVNKVVAAEIAAWDSDRFLNKNQITILYGSSCEYISQVHDDDAKSAKVVDDQNASRLE